MNTEQPDPAALDSAASSAEDRWLEQLLRQDAALDPYVADDGFTGRVIAALPMPVRLRSYSWLGPALGGVGVAMLAAFSPLAGELLAPVRAGFAGHWAPWQSLVVLVPMIALTYTAAWFAATDSD
jgi:hypothetical protein